MIAKTKVTFDMAFNSEGGECKTTVAFVFTDHPEIPVPDGIREMLIGEIRMLCGAMDAARLELFSEGAGVGKKRSDSKPRHSPSDQAHPTAARATVDGTENL